MRETSRYQLWHGVSRPSMRSIAFCEKVTGASPGGTPRHFWVPA